MGDGAVQEDRPDDRARGQGGQRRDAPAPAGRPRREMVPKVLPSVIRLLSLQAESPAAFLVEQRE